MKEELNISNNNSIENLLNGNKDCKTNSNYGNINSVNSSQNSNNYVESSSSSFISNTFEFENDLNLNMNDLSDEDLFNQIKNHVI